MASNVDDPQRTRQSLLDGIKDPENHKRWADFVDTYGGLIRNGARRTGLRNDEIEDVVQTVLVEVSRKAGEFTYDRSKGKFRSWLSTVTARRAIDQLRKRRPTEELKLHRPPGDNRHTRTVERYEGPDEADLAKTIWEEWLRALHDNTLKAVRAIVAPEQYQLYDAYVLKDWPVERVAKVFGVTPNQIYIAKTRVGKVVEEEGRRVAAEMDSPDMPPEHPSIQSTR